MKRFIALLEKYGTDDNLFHYLQMSMLKSLNEYIEAQERTVGIILTKYSRQDNVSIEDVHETTKQVYKYKELLNDLSGIFIKGDGKSPEPPKDMAGNYMVVINEDDISNSTRHNYYKIENNKILPPQYSSSLIRVMNDITNNEVQLSTSYMYRIPVDKNCELAATCVYINGHLKGVTYFSVKGNMGISLLRNDDDANILAIHNIRTGKSKYVNLNSIYEHVRIYTINKDVNVYRHRFTIHDKYISIDDGGEDIQTGRICFKRFNSIYSTQP